MMKRCYFIREVHWISEQPAILAMESAFAGAFYRCLSCYDQVPTFLWIGMRNLLLAAQPRCEEGIDWTSRAWTSETRKKMYCTRTFGNEHLGKQCSSLTSTIVREISNQAVHVAQFRTWSGGRLARKLEVWDWCLFSPHWDQYMVFLGNGIVNEFCRKLL